MIFGTLKRSDFSRRRESTSDELEWDRNPEEQP
jgi:hypothetical protein